MPVLTDEVEFKKFHVRFYMHPEGKLNKRLSEEKGYPVYEDLEKVEIRQAGDSKYAPHFNAQEESQWIDEMSGRRLTYAQVFDKQYQQFKANQEQIGEGTRIEVLPDITPAKVTQMKQVGVHTIEALAGLDGPNLKNLGMFGREMKDKAVKFLENASQAATNVELSRANERIAKLEAMLEGTMDTKQRSQFRQKDRQPLEEASIEPDEPSPFEGWADEDILAWLADNGKPDCKYEGKRLLTYANEIAAKKLEEREVA